MSPQRLQLIPHGETLESIAHRQAHNARVSHVTVLEVAAAEYAARVDARDAARSKAEAEMREKLRRDLGG